MSVGKRDIEIVKGDDYAHVVTLSVRTAGVVTPVDITGRIYVAQLKLTASQTSPSASFVCTLTDAAHGQVTLSLSHTVTAALVTGCYVWDLEQRASGVYRTILGGKATVSLGVST